MIANIFCTGLASLLLIDWIFMPKRARKAWYAMAVSFLFLGVTAIKLDLSTAEFVLLFAVSALLVRELFMSRAHSSQLNEQMTLLVRKIAITNAKILNEKSS